MPVTNGKSVQRGIRVPLAMDKKIEVLAAKNPENKQRAFSFEGNKMFEFALQHGYGITQTKKKK